jgi:ribosomal RNA-processing protein 36
MGEPTFRQLVRSDSERSKEVVTDGVKKRQNKHAPKEISSKIPASRFKPIKFFKDGEDPTSGTFIKKFKPRDPRFEKYSGNFNQGLFEASYSFLDDVRQEELQELKQALKSGDFIEQKEDLKKMIMKKKQEIQRMKDERREKKVKRELIKEEKNKVKEGKRPFFFKKGVIKMMALKEKIDEMKETGEYQEYRRKKRKREIYSEKFAVNQIPRKRREM